MVSQLDEETFRMIRTSAGCWKVTKLNNYYSCLKSVAERLSYLSMAWSLILEGDSWLGKESTETANKTGLSFEVVSTKRTN
jgi:hypothetical protein